MRDGCMIFEGFMDFLSYLTMNKQAEPQMDTVVLNSANQLKRAVSFLSRHSVIQAYLDNDTAGKQVLSEICREHSHVVDMSIQYEHCKDLNEYLVNQLKNNN